MSTSKTGQRIQGRPCYLNWSLSLLASMISYRWVKQSNRVLFSTPKQRLVVKRTREQDGLIASECDD